MKKKGNKCDFSSDRDAELRSVYREVMSTSEIISIGEASDRVAASPCSRFYVSEERAATVVSAIMRGVDALSGMNANKRRMFQEIHRRALSLIAARPRASLASVISEVIYSPAPEFYMSARYVRDRLTFLQNKIKAASPFPPEVQP